VGKTALIDEYCVRPTIGAGINVPTWSAAFERSGQIQIGLRKADVHHIRAEISWIVNPLTPSSTAKLLDLRGRFESSPIHNVLKSLYLRWGLGSKRSD
jgi:hypothetical protein